MTVRLSTELLGLVSNWAEDGERTGGFRVPLRVKTTRVLFIIGSTGRSEANLNKIFTETLSLTNCAHRLETHFFQVQCPTCPQINQSLSKL